MSFYSGLRLVQRSRLQGISESCSGALVGIRPASVVSPRKDYRCVPGRYDEGGAGPESEAPVTFDITRFDRNVLEVHVCLRPATIKQELTAQQEQSKSMGLKSEAVAVDSCGA